MCIYGNIIQHTIYQGRVLSLTKGGANGGLRI
jgi:hypothetical protein